MRRKLVIKAALAGGSVCLLCLASPLHAQTANGLVIEPRVFNDYPGSTETVNVNGGGAVATPTPTPAGNIAVPSLPASVTVHDTNMVNTPPAGFANRDDILLSTDHGVTPVSLSDQNGFTISANITLSDLVDSPRKEAGIRIDAPITGDCLFEVNSSGEIVAFGGGGPFFNFRPAIEPAYITGQTLFMKEIYTPPSGLVTQANPGTLEFIAQLLSPAGPVIDSGPLAFSNLEGGPGPNSFNVGFFDQAPDGNGAGGQTTAADFINASFNNINASVTVPEPASLSVLVLGGFAFLARRRSKNLV